MRKQIIGLLFAVCVLSISIVGQTRNEKAEIGRKIVGTWKLILSETTLKDGSKRQDFGPNGKAFILYSADGYMCFVGMDPDRPRWKDPQQPTQAEKAAALDTSFGYCGRYEIDAKRNQLIHLPEVSTWPGWYVGTRQIRPYRFEGDRLILSGGTVEEEPNTASWKVVWEKVR